MIPYVEGTLEQAVLTEAYLIVFAGFFYRTDLVFAAVCCRGVNH
jgi:hypothetical protein